MKPFASLFTAGRVFSGIILLVMVCFLWTGSEAVLTSLGVQTKTSLLQKLSVQTQTAKTALEANKSNQSALNSLQLENQRILKELKELLVKNEHAENKAAAITKTLEKKTASIKEVISKKKVVTDTTVTLPVKEVDAVSEVNITTLHEVYDQFFGSGQVADTSHTLT